MGITDVEGFTKYAQTQEPESAGRTGLVQLFTSGHLRSALVHLAVPSLLQNLTREQADYCVSHMKPYVDGKGRELPTAFDYVEFTRSLFVN